MEQKAKSFWERPEGTTGMLTIAAGAVGVWVASPIIVSGIKSVTSVVAALTGLAAQTAMLTVVGAGAAALLYVVFDPKVQRLAGYAFKLVMKKITGAFIEIDPIGIMELYIKQMSEKRETLSTTRDQLRGQLRVLQEKIAATDKAYTHSMNKALVAKQQNIQSVLTVESRNAIRMEEMNRDTYKPLAAQIEAHLRAVNKYHEVTGTVIDDLKNEVASQRERRKMIQASYSAMKAAKAIMAGGADERELFDQAMEYVVQDYGMKLGEIEQFMENSKPFVDGIDVQNGAFEAEALKRLQDWERRGDSILLGNTKTALIEQAPIQNFSMPAGDFSDFLGSSAKKETVPTKWQ